MRTPTILGMIVVSVWMGSTPVSSLSTMRNIASHVSVTCSPAREISLIGSRGAFAIIAPRACSQ